MSDKKYLYEYKSDSIGLAKIITDVRNELIEEIEEIIEDLKDIWTEPIDIIKISKAIEKWELKKKFLKKKWE